ncbi:Glycosyltransferase involved in cell wall bisynthesis [Parasphingorhabdus marina DSM 22363]|uniref:Glycosyltransferase involved in cell wall bisynthesis n=1 Tax=Parasphingorhabdus marina DSM 22363 TaxID=1123272 RepID=A0A1N6HRY8_9SPHN|nr:glycosyltransferase [Parasphingorhabdus marina]SIO22547.1 Glycosyltransferase involved in cell wall bisynthesis [Parasphingorhabdus marina DSM 22363]
MEMPDHKIFSRTGQMNVLFLTSTLPRFAGDMQPAFVLDQARAWQADRPADRVSILAPHDASAEREEMTGGVRVRRFRYAWPERAQQLAYPAILPNIKERPVTALLILPFLIAQFFSALFLVRKEQLDLIYAHWVMPQGLTAWLIRLCTGTPYIIQNHSSDLAVFSRLGGPGRALARTIIRASEKLFCVNSAQRRAALDLFPAAQRAQMEHKILTLPMGVESDFAAADQSRYDETADFRYDFGTISRLSRKKGLPHLIDALSGLQREGLTVSAGIAGDGEDREALVAAASDADIEFPGYLSGAGKKRFFEQTKVFVFTSVAAGSDVEGLPVSLLEALCLGKMVIASRDTNIEMLPEWDALQQEIFFVADPADLDSLKQALRSAQELDMTELSRRSARIRQIMSRYRWERLITEYLGSAGIASQPVA